MYSLLKPVLFRVDPETAHNLLHCVGRAAQYVPLALPLLRRYYHIRDDRLHISVLGIDFENPVGIAAGFDKNAHLPEVIYSLGFGFQEIGSISARPSKGNPRPRLFRLPDDNALVNRLGLNNDGAAAIAERLQFASFPYPVGISLVKTHDPSITGSAAIDDFVESFTLLSPFASYVTLNVSCPNTTEGKTFEEPEALEQLLLALSKHRHNVPILVKISPDLSDSQLERVLNVCSLYKVAGYVVANTTSSRGSLATPPSVLDRIGKGGVSGPPLFERVRCLVTAVYDRTEGKVPIIGVGGVHSAETAYAMIKAGASLVQLYTGFVYEGPSIAKNINQGLLQLMENDGLSSIADAVGKDHKRKT